MKKFLSLVLVVCMLLATTAPFTALADEADLFEITIDDNDVGSGLNQFSYSAGWALDEGYFDRFYNGTDHWVSQNSWASGNAADYYYTVRFYGTKIELYGSFDSRHGIAAVTIDGVDCGSFDAYAASRRNFAKLFDSGELAPGVHVLKVSATGRKNPSAAQADLQIDYAKVYTASLPPDFDQEFEINIDDYDTGTGVNRFGFSSGWVGEQGYPALFYNGTDHYVDQSRWASGNPADYYYTVRFYGTGIELYGSVASNHGIAAVTIDGVDCGTFDMYAATRRNFTKLYESGELALGEHVLKVSATGQKNPASSKADIQVDYAKVYAPLVRTEEVRLVSEDGPEVVAGLTYTPVFEVAPAWATFKSLLYSVDDPSVATVDKYTGETTGVAPGQAVITAKSIDGKTAACTINVVPFPYFPGPLIGLFGDSGRRYGVIDGEDPTAKPSDYAQLLREVVEDPETLFEGVGWRGDTVVTQLVLLSKNEPVSGIGLEVGPLTHTRDASAVIDESLVKVSSIDYTRASMNRGGYDGPYQFIPDVINYPGVVREEMIPYSVQSLWVAIDIPKDAKPGFYEGDILVKADDAEPTTFTVRVEVQNLVQTDIMDNEFHLDLWQYPYSIARYYDVEPFSDEHFKYLESVMELFRDAGGKTVTTTIVHEAWNHQTYDSYPSMVTWTKKLDGSFAFDFTIFDKWVQFCLDLGFKKQISCYSLAPWGNRIYYYDEADGPDGALRYISPAPTSGAAWSEPWGQFLKAFTAHLDEKGWFDMTYIAMDERDMATMTAVLDLVESFPSKDGNTLKVSGAMNYSSLDASILDRIADISVNIGHLASGFQNFSQARRDKGLYTTLYVCTGNYPNNFTQSVPAEGAWIIWSTLKYNADGFLRWAYDSWVEDPLVSTDHWSFESGDCFQIYPAAPGNYTARSSHRYELIRQGIRDVEKLKLLKQYDPSLAAGIDALTADISYSANAETILAGMADKRAKMFEYAGKYLSDIGMTDLIEAIQTYEDAPKPDGWVGNVAYEDAKAVRDDPDAVRDDIVKATADLNAVNENLQYLAPIQEMIAFYEQSEINKYTPATYIPFATAALYAKEIYAKYDAAPGEIFDAWSELNDAKAALDDQPSFALKPEQPKSVKLKAGETWQLQVETNTALIYVSTAPNVVSVTQTGLLTGIKAGNAVITIRALLNPADVINVVVSCTK